MKILFTKSAAPLSKLIVSATKEPVSHVALDFGWFVVHSNLRGLHLSWAKSFKSKVEVVHQLERAYEGQALHDMRRLDQLLGKYEFSLYDFGALLYLSLMLTLRKYLRLPLPKSNLWQSTGMFLCTEWVSTFLDGEEDSLITPYKLYLKLKSTGEWRDSYGKETESGWTGESDR